MLPASELSETALAVLVDRFYARVRQDPEIGPVFAGAVHDWPEHLETLTAFWSSVMLTSGRYKGSPMAAHMRLPLTPAMFDRWLALWTETTAEVFAPEIAAVLQAKAQRIAQSLQLALFFRPGAAPGATPARIPAQV
jgi:hemoglobin